MYFHEIRPFVRFARLFMPGPSSCGHAVIARDCRLFLLQSGQCTMLTEGCDAFVMQPGACLLVPAGIPYTILPSAGTDPLFYIVNFDFTWEHAALSQTLPLLSPGETGEILSAPQIVDCPMLCAPLPLADMAFLETELLAIEAELADQRLFFQGRASALMASVLTQIARTQCSDQPRHPQAVNTMIRFIQNNYAQPLSNAQISGAVGYHPNYANRLFLQHTQQTMHQYLISCRIRRALELLLSTEKSITEIASEVGFSSLSRFTKEFTHQTGNAPSRYRGCRQKRSEKTPPTEA